MLGISAATRTNRGKSVRGNGKRSLVRDPISPEGKKEMKPRGERSTEEHRAGREAARRFGPTQRDLRNRGKEPREKQETEGPRRSRKGAPEPGGAEGAGRTRGKAFQRSAGSTARPALRPSGEGPRPSKGKRSPARGRPLTCMTTSTS